MSSFNRQLTSTAECALCCYCPKNNHKRYNLPFSVSFYFPLPPYLEPSTFGTPMFILYQSVSRFSFFFSRFFFYVSRFQVDGFHHQRRLLTFNLLFILRRAKSRGSVCKSSAEKPCHATTGMNKMLTAVTSGLFLSKLNTQVS